MGSTAIISDDPDVRQWSTNDVLDACEMAGFDIHDAAILTSLLYELRPQPCSSCGHDPACGQASVTVGGVTSWLCHDDDHSCYAPDSGSLGTGS